MPLSRMTIDYLYQDGTTGTAQPNMFDRVEYDKIAAQRKWPPIQQGISLWTAFLVWHWAARTQGLKDSFEHFLEHTLEQASMSEGEPADVDPTRTTPPDGP